MIVCAHGNVSEYCDSRGMVIAETWEGDFREYCGKCSIIVTDADISEAEYYFEKGKLLAVGIELISTRYTDDPKVVNYITYAMSRDDGKKRRVAFGYRRKGERLVEVPEEMAVIAKIRGLSNQGMTIREIQAADGVCYTDGRRLSVSMIHNILKRRED